MSRVLTAFSLYLYERNVIEEGPDRVFLPARPFPAYKALVEDRDGRSVYGSRTSCSDHSQRPISGS